jgi:hypothetical protein
MFLAGGVLEVKLAPLFISLNDKGRFAEACVTTYGMDARGCHSHHHTSCLSILIGESG